MGSKPKIVFEFPTFYARKVANLLNHLRGNKTNRASNMDETNWKGVIDCPEGNGSRDISKMANVFEGNCAEVYSFFYTN